MIDITDILNNANTYYASYLKTQNITSLKTLEEVEVLKYIISREKDTHDLFSTMIHSLYTSESPLVRGLAVGDRQKTFYPSAIVEISKKLNIDSKTCMDVLYRLRNDTFKDVSTAFDVLGHHYTSIYNKLDKSFSLLYGGAVGRSASPMDLFIKHKDDIIKIVNSPKYSDLNLIDLLAELKKNNISANQLLSGTHDNQIFKNVLKRIPDQMDKAGISRFISGFNAAVGETIDNIKSSSLKNLFSNIHITGRGSAIVVGIAAIGGFLTFGYLKSNKNLESTSDTVLNGIENKDPVAVKKALEPFIPSNVEEKQLNTFTQNVVNHSKDIVPNEYSSTWNNVLEFANTYKFIYIPVIVFGLIGALYRYCRKHNKVR